VNVLDLLAVVAVCLTAIVCFVIRASHGADVEALGEDVETVQRERDEARTELDDLKRVVTENAKAFAAFRAEVKTSMSMGRK